MNLNAYSQLCDKIAASENKEKTYSDALSSLGSKINASEIVIIKDRIPIITSDPGNDYNRLELEKTHDIIREQLSLFSDLEDEKEKKHDKRRSTEAASGKPETAVWGSVVGSNNRRSNAILLEQYSRFYTEKHGWNGEEGEPWTVDRQWESFGFVDFLDVEIKSPTHLAELFSIYRNPHLEYFHIVLTRKDRIVRQICISSGLSGVTRAIPADSDEAICKLIQSTKFDGAYLIHNHPSGNISPSDPDISITNIYKKAIFGDTFRGHIILDHTCFNWISAGNDQISESKTPYRPHQIPLPPKTISDAFSSPAEIAKYVQETHCSGSVLFELNNKHQLVTISPFDIHKYAENPPAGREKLISYMKSKFIRQCVLLTDDQAGYEKFKSNAFNEPLLDCIYVNQRYYRSVLEERSSCLSSEDWQSVQVYANKDSAMKYDMAFYTQCLLFEEAELPANPIEEIPTEDGSYETALNRLEIKTRNTMKAPLTDNDRAYCEYLQTFVTASRQAQSEGLPPPKLLSIREFLCQKQPIDKESSKRSR